MRAPHRANAAAISRFHNSPPSLRSGKLRMRNERTMPREAISQEGLECVRMHTTKDKQVPHGLDDILLDVLLFFPGQPKAKIRKTRGFVKRGKIGNSWMTSDQLENAD